MAFRSLGEYVPENAIYTLRPWPRAEEADSHLVHYIADKGDPEAFCQVAREYSGMIYATCVGILRNSAEAEDAAQECFLELARRAGSLTATSLAAWLHVTARSRALNVVRGETRRRRREEAAMAETQETAEPLWADVAPHVDEALAGTSGEEMESVSEQIQCTRQKKGCEGKPRREPNALPAR